MTDYNDGLWHGWNGGECPVHPESVVNYASTHNGNSGDIPARALNWAWADSHRLYPVIAFRVVKAYREPRECWSYGAHILYTEAEAIAFRNAVAADYPGKGYETNPITKWREVIE